MARYDGDVLEVTPDQVRTKLLEATQNGRIDEALSRSGAKRAGLFARIDSRLSKGLALREADSRFIVELFKDETLAEVEMQKAFDDSLEEAHRSMVRRVKGASQTNFQREHELRKSAAVGEIQRRFDVARRYRAEILDGLMAAEQSNTLLKSIRATTKAENRLNKAETVPEKFSDYTDDRTADLIRRYNAEVATDDAWPLRKSEMDYAPERSWSDDDENTSRKSSKRELLEKARTNLNRYIARQAQTGGGRDGSSAIPVSIIERRINRHDVEWIQKNHRWLLED